jgi:hypothetical protein
MLTVNALAMSGGILLFTASMQDAKVGSNSTGLTQSTRPFGGIRFTAAQAGIAYGARLDIDTVTTAGSITAKLYNFNDSSAIATSSALSVSTTGLIDFRFTTPVTIAASADLVLEFVVSGASASYLLSTVTDPGTGVAFGAVQSLSIYNITADNNVDANEDLRCGLILEA